LNIYVFNIHTTVYGRNTVRNREDGVRVGRGDVGGGWREQRDGIT
jgi:hypothetical protein